ncbi:kelch motif family protein [Stylonychia lemnae]|uniref:Kelch motif family protein n=1 Tax=Stylonychia lemnae TaxID=5949 RepID=A0A078AW98_STYLE|nr:kelch motif family protein [Stylonychia lemnae]|eukprot:CDW86351.1 kelch motif family protein [Stylonychia lemnae]
MTCSPSYHQDTLKTLTLRTGMRLSFNITCLLAELKLLGSQQTIGTIHYKLTLIRIYVLGGEDGGGMIYTLFLTVVIDKIARHTMTFIKSQSQKSVIVIGGQRGFQSNERKFELLQMQNERAVSQSSKKIPYKIPSFCFKLELNEVNRLYPVQIELNQSQLIYKVNEIDSHTANLLQQFNQIVLFGGYLNSATLSSIVLSIDLDNNVLTQIDARGKGPQPRCEHSSCYIENENSILYFGGKTGHLGDRLNDLWMLNLNQNTWIEIRCPINVNVWPCARSGQGMIYFEEGLVFLFGGRGNDSVIQELNDLWTFNVKTKDWIQQHAFSNPQDSAFDSPVSEIRLTRMIRNLKHDYQSPLRRPTLRHQITRQDTSQYRIGNIIKLQSTDSNQLQFNQSKQINQSIMDESIITSNQQTFQRLPIEENIITMKKVQTPKDFTVHQIKKKKRQLSDDKQNSSAKTSINFFDRSKSKFDDLKNFPEYFVNRIEEMKQIKLKKSSQSQSVHTAYQGSRKDNAFKDQLQMINENPYFNYVDYLERTKNSSQFYAKEHEKFQSQFKLDLPKIKNNQNSNLGVESVKTSHLNFLTNKKQQHQIMMKIRMSTPNPNVSWDSRDALSFRSKTEMMINKEQYEKKLSKMRVSHSKIKLNQAMKSNNQAEMELIKKRSPRKYELVRDDDDLSPVSSNMKNTFICQVKELGRLNKHNKPSIDIQKEGCKILGSRPCQRDGFVFLVLKDEWNDKYLVVFGGDRFKRAFNDLFIYKLK